jgi:hypothetical protein
MVLLRPLIFLLLVPFVVAQQSQSSTSRTASSNTTQASNTAAPNVTLAIVTSVPVTRTTVSAGNTVQITSFVPTTVLSTIAPNITATSTANATANATATPTQSSGPVLDTRVDPGFGVLGALLILTGLPSAFLGHKNRWYDGGLSGSLECF